MNPYVYQALVIKAGLSTFVKTGMRVNRAYTPSAMMRTAARITGRTFRPRDYYGAIAALNIWIAAQTGTRP